MHKSTLVVSPLSFVPLSLFGRASRGCYWLSGNTGPHPIAFRRMRPAVQPIRQPHVCCSSHSLSLYLRLSKLCNVHIARLFVLSSYLCSRGRGQSTSAHRQLDVAQYYPETPDLRSVVSLPRFFPDVSSTRLLLRSPSSWLRTFRWIAQSAFTFAVRRMPPTSPTPWMSSAWSISSVRRRPASVRPCPWSPLRRPTFRRPRSLLFRLLSPPRRATSLRSVAS